MDYIGRELAAKEMTTEVFIGWISFCAIIMMVLGAILGTVMS